MNKNKKILIIVTVSILVLTGAFFFPKEVKHCGSLAGGVECYTERCAGIFLTKQYSTMFTSDCVGFYLGTSDPFIE